MDIEDLVTRAYTSWAHEKGTSWTDHMKAALTEISAAHAIKMRAYEATVQNQAERISQLEAERVPEGWKLVPVEPTADMIDAGRWMEYMDEGDTALSAVENDAVLGVWSHMLAAAPRRCHLCDYQHGHKIGCLNNPVDIALRAAAPAKEGE